jgi:anti-sigma regulatory factor (Ser/Thr protein kinase)
MVARTHPDAGAHLVHFYEDDADLVARVADYLADGARRNETAVVIATPPHLDAIAAQFPAGEVVALDAADTLARFMVDGVPDAERFDEVIGTTIRQASAGGSRARAYGEMVALLWDEGNVTGALELERLWNGLLEDEGFTLFCAYPTSIINDDQTDPLAQVCALHSVVVDARVPLPLEEIQSFPYAQGSPTAARRFVASTLRRWGIEQAVDDASLVATELASNAVVHGGADFVVRLTWADDVVTISVEDQEAALPAARAKPGTENGGRGLRIVDAIAQEWGAEPSDSGKVVWARLRPTGARA